MHVDERIMNSDRNFGPGGTQFPREVGPVLLILCIQGFRSGGGGTEFPREMGPPDRKFGGTEFPVTPVA